MPSMHVQARSRCCSRRGVGFPQRAPSWAHDAHADARPALRVDELRDLLLAPPVRSTRVEIVDAHRVDQHRPRRATCAPTRPRGRTRACSSPSTRPAGRGRAGRSWETPRGDGADLQLRGPPAGPGRVASAGSRCSPASAPSTRCGPPAGVPAMLKWPNDLLVPADTEVEGWGPVAQDRRHPRRGRRRCPPGSRRRSSSGSGSTCSQTADELPVPSATSLALAGAQHVDREGMLVALVDAQLEVAQRWRDSGGDAVGSGLADEVARRVQHARRRGCASSCPGGASVERASRRGSTTTAPSSCVDDDGVTAPRARG